MTTALQLARGLIKRMGAMMKQRRREDGKFFSHAQKKRLIRSFEALLESEYLCSPSFDQEDSDMVRLWIENEHVDNEARYVHITVRIMTQGEYES